MVNNDKTEKSYSYGAGKSDDSNRRYLEVAAPSKSKRLFGKIIGILITIAVGSWVLLGTQIRYGPLKKERFGTSQEIQLWIWGERVK
jgi:hypothetical protein